MRGDASPAARFRRLVHDRLLPGLGHLGFDQRPPGVLAGADSGGGTRWMLDLEIAPWTTPARICFSVAWGVDIPGVGRVLDDPAPPRSSLDTALVRGVLGQSEIRLEPTWFELKARPRPVPWLVDPSLSQHVIAAVHREVLPRLTELSTPLQVQQALFEKLQDSSRLPTAEELTTIRRITAISLLLGDREHALRWIEHLRDRLAAAMAPDVAAEHVEPLRRLCLAS
jgi:hypothetical protein